MKILNFRTINVPSVYHRKPVLIMKLYLEIWTDQLSQEIYGFTENLMETFQNLIEHTCSPGNYGETVYAGKKVAIDVDTHLETIKVESQRFKLRES